MLRRCSVLYLTIKNKDDPGSPKPIDPPNAPVGDAVRGWWPAVVRVGEYFELVQDEPDSVTIYDFVDGERRFYTTGSVEVHEVVLADTVMGRCEQIWNRLGRLSNDVAELQLITGVGLATDVASMIATLATLIAKLGLSGNETVAELIRQYGSPVAGGLTTFWNGTS